MKHHPALHDLSQHLQKAIGEVVARQIGIAQHVLEPVDLTLMLMQASVSLCLTTAATASASLGEDADQEAVGDFFDFTLKSIADLARTDRERSIGKVMAKRAAASA